MGGFLNNMQLCYIDEPYILFLLYQFTTLVLLNDN